MFQLICQLTHTHCKIYKMMQSRRRDNNAGWRHWKWTKIFNEITLCRFVPFSFQPVSIHSSPQTSTCLHDSLNIVFYTFIHSFIRKLVNINLWMSNENSLCCKKRYKNDALSKQINQRKWWRTITFRHYIMKKNRKHILWRPEKYSVIISKTNVFTEFVIIHLGNAVKKENLDLRVWTQWRCFLWINTKKIGKVTTNVRIFSCHPQIWCCFD